ncbi:tripartite tricarboxylate transporter substrate-binding protein [Pseudomonas sp. nanlin1]|uniref:tripartite tricarboxylate transporter substrate-binding protein n=1 Tax=Pseudomonas sp. nanlin1 TaxID=3040605 RepID=UPI003890AD1B
MITRRHFLATTSLLMAGAALPAWAGAAPASGGRLVFGLPQGAVGNILAGGALNILAKQFATDYRLDIIDAQNTQQASNTVKKAAPDGSTLLQAQSGSMVLFPSVYRSLGYDPLTDFTPLAVMGEYAFALTVGPAVPAQVKTVDQYLSWVKSNPDYRDIGFTLYGSQSHLVSLILGRSKEIAIRPQSYKTVDSLMGDLRSQSLAAAVTIAGSTPRMPMEGFRTLAITGNQRLNGLDAPTFAESGVPNLDIKGWYGWFAPANLPAATATAWQERLRALQATEDFTALQKSLLLTQAPISPAAIRQRMSNEMQEYRKLVSSYGLSQIA